MGGALRFCLSFAFAISLVACAGAAPSAVTPTTNATLAAVATAITTPPIATRISAATSGDAPATQIPSATITPQRISVPLYLGIEQGTTPDGFPTLGRPDAPIVLSDYSDFL